MPQKYTPEFKARALKLIEERVRAEQCSGWVACTAVGEALGGISPHTLRNWWKQDRVDQGELHRRQVLARLRHRRGEDLRGQLVQAPDQVAGHGAEGWVSHRRSCRARRSL